MRVRRPLLIALAAAAVACGTKATTIAITPTPIPPVTHPPSPTPIVSLPSAPAAPYRVWVKAEGQLDNAISIVDAAARKTSVTMPDGIFSPDFSRLYTTAPAAGGVALQTIDAHSGTVLQSLSISGNYHLPYVGIGVGGLSPDGHWLVLDGTVRSGATGPTISRYIVVDTGGATALRRVALDGDFLFDGISNSGGNLYLLENVAPNTGHGAQYHVRRYDMAAGALNAAVIVDKQSPNETMNGAAIAHTNSADGTWQYTVYAFGDRGPVVHALDLAHSTAVCIDLPPGNNRLNQEWELLWSLALDAAHHRLYAVNGATGSVAVIDVSGYPRIIDTATVKPQATPQAADAGFFGGGVTVAEAKRAILGGATLSPDASRLYAIGDASLLVIDTARLHLQRELFAGRTLFGIGLSPDGRYIWAAADGSLLQLDLTAEGDAARQVAPDHTAGILHVEPVTP